MQLDMKLFSLFAVTVFADQFTQRLGFDPGMFLTIPPGSAEAVTRYFTPEVFANFSAQLKANPPVRLRKPGNQVPVTRAMLKEYFEMTYLTFCPGKMVIDFDCICSKEYTDIIEINNPISQASVIVVAFPRKRTIAVSYAFTRSFRNWLTDLDAAAIQMPGAPEGVKVHYGLYSHYMSVHNETMAVVSKLIKTKYKGYQIFASGYSLGASVAVLSAPFWHEFKQTHDAHVFIISYAGPRVGNLALKLYFESLSVPISRYTNQNDVVSMLPPRGLDYSHPGVEIYEYATSHNTTTFVTCSQEYDEDPNCQWRERYHPSALRHIFPSNSFVPLPPYCSRFEQS
ncbi:hypothetical protein DSO57_1012642 [Entomophthora muscae]|uniref:Uncharacterized protein n=1 Tax=Entomophthora muscae TaxID=34485 RepID=A0ACC2S7P4_9FUNG|nr:hypothetical protein DSO57_1012642 [Entomophthora muscae]